MPTSWPKLARTTTTEEVCPASGPCPCAPYPRVPQTPNRPQGPQQHALTNGGGPQGHAGCGDTLDGSSRLQQHCGGATREPRHRPHHVGVPAVPRVVPEGLGGRHHLSSVSRDTHTGCNSMSSTGVGHVQQARTLPGLYQGHTNTHSQAHEHKLHALEALKQKERSEWWAAGANQATCCTMKPLGASIMRV